MSGIIICVIHYSDGVDFYEPVSSTFPGSFFDAYYKIIDNFVPNAYTIVVPDIDSTMTINREHFMDYKYFLNKYTRTDSLYYAQDFSIRLRNKFKRKKKRLPNLFVFLENKPYNSIEIGIMPHQKTKMVKMYDWISRHKAEKKRKIRTYFKSKRVTVFEIVNDPNQSSIDNILFNQRKGGKS